MTEPEPPHALKDLDARLSKARAEHDAEKEKQRGAKGGGGAGSGMGFGFRIAIDIIAALIVGVGLGLLLDQWLGTEPFLLIVFFFLGAAAGMLNVYRTATGQGFAVGYAGGQDKKSEPEGDQQSGSPEGETSGSQSKPNKGEPGDRGNGT